MASERGPEVSSAAVLKVWGIASRHFESLLASAERSDTKTRAEINIKSQVKELRDLIAKCSRRLCNIEECIRKLENQETNYLNTTSGSYSELLSTELTGEWHFLYLPCGNVFGYMKLVPQTVSVTSAEGSAPVKKAEFTIPIGVLQETEGIFGDCDNRLGQECVSCPCCQMSVRRLEFWKHALFEIASRGNRVPAWQLLDRSERPKWVVDVRAGWSDPIYRPRDLSGISEIGQSLEELNLRHFLSDHEFSRALDVTFDFVVKELTS